MEPVLKFRVWDSLLKQWRNSPQLVLRPDGKVTDGSISIEEPVQFVIDLKDKNGKEIYEGDLVKFGYTENHDFFGRVTWFEDRACFGVRTGNAFETFEDLMDYMKYFEVVGNIYELPCKPDHNGECLVCDCWLCDCPFLTLSK
jgi:hypothetical protein